MVTLSITEFGNFQENFEGLKIQCQQKHKQSSNLIFSSSFIILLIIGSLKTYFESKSFTVMPPPVLITLIRENNIKLFKYQNYT